MGEETRFVNCYLNPWAICHICHTSENRKRKNEFVHPKHIFDQMKNDLVMVGCICLFQGDK